MGEMACLKRSYPEPRVAADLLRWVLLNLERRPEFPPTAGKPKTKNESPPGSFCELNAPTGVSVNFLLLALVHSCNRIRWARVF